MCILSVCGKHTCAMDIQHTYDTYIHIHNYEKNSTIQLTSVGLAHACPIYLATISPLRSSIWYRLTLSQCIYKLINMMHSTNCLGYVFREIGTVQFLMFTYQKELVQVHTCMVMRALEQFCYNSQRKVQCSRLTGSQTQHTQPVVHVHGKLNSLTNIKL